MLRRRSPRVGPGLWTVLFLLAVGGTGCQQATSDPDAAVKALITATTWDNDTSYTGEDAMVIRFYSDGSATYNAQTRSGVWTYQSGVFTITTVLGTFTTVASDFSVSATHLTFTYVSGLCHLVPKDTTNG